MRELQAFLTYLGAAYRLGFYTMLHVLAAALRSVHVYTKLHCVSLRAVVDWHIESWRLAFSRRPTPKRKYWIDVLLSAATFLTWPVLGPLWVYYAVRKLAAKGHASQDTTQPAGLD